MCLISLRARSSYYTLRDKFHNGLFPPKTHESDDNIKKYVLNYWKNIPLNNSWPLTSRGTENNSNLFHKVRRLFPSLRERNYLGFSPTESHCDWKIVFLLCLLSALWLPIDARGPKQVERKKNTKNKLFASEKLIYAVTRNQIVFFKSESQH